ncbi:hypothetical protein [Pseudomonas putida]|uniref:hypothetical protein n=1 Tax=Pseudomonas putida TaxID=303 RepID=UPI00035EBED9|nr:hypothetical protein [Pseudomonas putida]ANC80470.1 hypothetical protein KKK_05440 [Pseudomonas putida B6-2]
MLTIGVVERISRNRIAIWVEEPGGYTVIELKSDAVVEQGDVMCWPDRYSTGRCAYWNATKGWNTEVVVCGHDVPLHLLRQQLVA